MRFIDANVILRYILNDHAELSPKVKSLIDAKLEKLLTVIAKTKG
jgi:predicted nucleic acid-binding protein